MKPHFILILLVFPAACIPNTQTNSEQVARQDGAVPPPIIAADTPPAGDLLAPAYPPPPALPTSPYPGPVGSGWQPGPTPTIGIQPIDDYELHPIFSRCGGIHLSGKVAYIQPNGRLTVLDLDTERAWSSSQAGVKDVAWSPAGNLLLALNSRSGEVAYSGLSIPADTHFDWHLSEPGLLVTTNLSGSDVMSIGTLAVWHLLENQVTSGTL
jgi:hypothetical protein